MSNHPISLLLVGVEGSEFRLAAEMARANGADVSTADNAVAALKHLRAHGADLVMIDVCLDVVSFLERMRAERLSVPVIACGIDAPARIAVAAIHAGARDYLPLPPEAELIAAAIQTFASRMAAPIEIEALVGHTVADVERELILQTLERCQGNRTSASTILGISVRTMRNKLRTFIEAGIPVSPAA
ncbi:helix-turn-helix domain-containing protein [Allosphingosinicella deserti]|uniref:Fis family transcriptional regulator n=1 Tax=Allosphingosinicella deserti TaxID=2116704 RepID=A0A2P7QVH3_9SPHN|nr:helix-turn-helix domain-containing protein [Sphingomonas deserti]PSJ41968.1 Fis family transcriptional regulator [Sphingomonas deserti]